MDKYEFETWLDLVCDNPEKITKVMKFGGLKTVLRTLNDEEIILNVSFILYDCEEHAAVSIFMSKDLAILTSKRILIFQDRLFGTLVKEIPLKTIKSYTYTSSSMRSLRINVNAIGKNFSWLFLGTDADKEEAKVKYDEWLS